MNEIIPKTYENNLLDIYKCLYARDFKKAELVLLDTFDKILKISHDGSQTIAEALITTNIICNEFNDFYLAWVKDINGNLEKEMYELSKMQKIDNYLLAHCHDFVSMDNLFYELLNYLINNCKPKCQEEIYQQIYLYKKTWQEI
jgi:hypothetical protein